MAAAITFALSEGTDWDAMRALAFTIDGKVRRPIDYRNLGSEELGSIYEALLGKESGPQAGWLLAALDAGFVQARLREAARDAA